MDIDVLSHPDGESQTKSMAMLDSWLENILDNSVVKNFWSEKDFSIFYDFENNIVDVPGNPDDYIVAMVLFRKIQSILHPYVQLTEIKLMASPGSGMEYALRNEDIDLPNIQEWIGNRYFWEKPWWSRLDGDTTDIIPDPAQDLNEKPPFIDLRVINAKETSSNVPVVTDSANQGMAKIMSPDFKLRVIRNDQD